MFVMIRLAHGNIVFNILEEFSFQKYTTCWVFLVLRYMLYLCICGTREDNATQPLDAGRLSFAIYLVINPLAESGIPCIVSVMHS